MLNLKSRPIIIGDLPVDACIVVNTQLNTRIIAKASCAGENVTDIQIIGTHDLNLIISPLASFGNYTWYKNLSWIPPGNGEYSICTVVIDTTLFSTDQSCFTILVGEMPDPSVIPSSLYPASNTLIYANSSKQSQVFMCQFNFNILQPPQPVYIRVYSAQTNAVVFIVQSPPTFVTLAQSASPYEYDYYHFGTFNFNVTFFLMNNSIMFTIPVGMFPFGTFYILFDYGKVYLMSN